MATTESLCIPYDEDSLSIDEQNELEEFCFGLQVMLEQKINDMGLTIVQGGYGNYITKFTKEELNEMEENYNRLIK